jgi:sec1 family domain-containing protein 1
MSSFAPSTLTTQSPPSLRELQRAALLKLLNLNSQDDQNQASELPQIVDGEPVWKFLVFDKLGQDVISSVLRVSDLREAGVTVHMQMKADRQQMEDVPASTSQNSVTDIVYLVEPTEGNISLIANVLPLFALTEGLATKHI